jgi:hypothetical protein
MSEEFLQYIWNNRLFEEKVYMSSTGETVTILNQGIKNFDAGPDFCDARIKIGGTTWVGNCEVHVNSSGWQRHNHQNDKNYENVILHVVKKNDAEARTSNRRIVPTIELAYPKKLEENFIQLLESRQWVACADQICKMENFFISHYLTSLAIERLESRSNDILNRLKQNKNNWENTFYQFLSRGFGFKVNALPFEMLAQSIPLNTLAKHRNNLFKTEALLFGQSGLLNKTPDEYSEALKREYHFLQKKYKLKPINAHLWKSMRTRPANFPTIRIAQLAALLNQSTSLFSKILEEKKLSSIKAFLNVKASDYWDNHYQFGQVSKIYKKYLTTDSIYLLLLNAIIPTIFVYGKIRNLSDFKDRALTYLESLPPEKNSIIKKWTGIGMPARNAFETQALLELRNEYCEVRKCLLCAIGSKLISNIS